MKRVIEILKQEGPLLSGNLAEKLIEKFGISPEAARKVISRTNEPVRKLFNINFDNKQKYLYLDDHFSSGELHSGLLEILNKSSKAYYAFIQAIIFHNGFINKKQLPSYTFSPIKPLKGHRSAEKIISDLLKANIIINYNDEVYQLSGLLFQLSNYSRFKAIEVAKRITLEQFNDWARNMNIIAYNMGRFFDSTAEFYKFQWSFTAPSYLGVGSSITKKPSTFVAMDILLGKDIEEIDILYLIKKLKIIYNAKNVASIIPVLILDRSISPNAFKLLKNEGIMIGFIDQLFGRQYSELLKSLINVIENSAAIISKNPDLLVELMDKLSVLEGKSYNLRGDLFELAVGYYYSAISQFFEINKLIIDPKTNKKKEIDVFAKCPKDEIIIVECKGYNYPVDEEYINKWLNDNIPAIRRWLLTQDDYSKKKIIFEIWSTSGFNKEAERLLEEKAKNTKIYTIRYLGKKEILDASKEQGNKNLQKIVQKYFSQEFNNNK